MKYAGVVFAFFLMMACKSSDKKKTETAATVETGASLEQRLAEFLKLTDSMDLEKTLEYTYPKLFTIVPRDQLLQAMKEGFSNEEVKVELDSVRVEKVHPVFEEGNGSYAKVIYSMVMVMRFADGNPEDQGAGSMKMILNSLEEKYGKDHVRMSEDAVIRINNTSPMVAVKDEFSKDWTFVNLKEGDPMTDKLFSKAVQDKLATYK